MRRKDNAQDYEYFEHLTREQMLDQLVAYSKSLHRLIRKVQVLQIRQASGCR